MLLVIEEFPDYSVNEYGEVYSRKSHKWLSRRIYEGGYWGVNLRDNNGKNVYRSVTHWLPKHSTKTRIKKV